MVSTFEPALTSVLFISRFFNFEFGSFRYLLHIQTHTHKHTHTHTHTQPYSTQGCIFFPMTAESLKSLSLQLHISTPKRYYSLHFSLLFELITIHANSDSNTKRRDEYKQRKGKHNSFFQSLILYFLCFLSSSFCYTQARAHARLRCCCACSCLMSRGRFFKRVFSSWDKTPPCSSRS